MKKHRLNGLYCITDPTLTAQSALTIEDMVQAAIDGGAKIIQYRDKQASPSEQTDIAHRLCQRCQKQQVTFLVNDNPQLAKTVDADGVHLGQSDTGLREARDLLGKDKIIGISCHASLALAMTAQQQGADYVAFGRFFTSQTKPEASPAPIELLNEARTALSIPVVAIGGITLDNAGPLLMAGADMLAVIHAVFGQTNIQQAASLFAELFEKRRA